MNSPAIVVLGFGLLAGALPLLVRAAPDGAAARALPIEPLAHLSTIQVRINDTGPYTFVIDTGAAVTVIDQALSDKLGLTTVGTTEVGSPMGAAPLVVDSLSIASITIGDVIVANPPAIEMDLSGIFAQVQVPDGILAAASIEGHVMTINFAEGFVLLRPGALHPVDDHRVLAYDGDSVVPRVPISVSGVKMTAALDCGAPSGLSVPASYAETLPLNGPPTVTGRGRTVDAGFEIRESRLEGTVEIGDIRLENPMIAFNEKSKTAHIGMNILGNYSISIDRTNRRVAFDKTEAKTAERPSRRMIRKGSTGPSYGIQLGGVGGDVLAVLGTEPGLPAEAAGLLAGDEIVALNGTAVKLLDNGARVTALRGSPLKLGVSRGGEKFEITLSHD